MKAYLKLGNSTNHAQKVSKTKISTFPFVVKSILSLNYKDTIEMRQVYSLQTIDEKETSLRLLIASIVEKMRP